MLSVFPIQFLALFAYFFLRVCVASILLYLGYTHMRHYSELKDILKFWWWPFGAFSAAVFAMGELLLGSLLFVGAYTQLAALFVVLLSLKMLIVKGYFIHPTIPSRLFYVLLLGAALSLVITGAGVFAFDLPI